MPRYHQVGGPMTNNMGKVAFALPGLSEGSGGMNTILRNAEALMSAGYECSLFFPPCARMQMTEEEARDALRNWYEFDHSCSIHISSPGIPGEYQLAIATFWETAGFVARQPCAHKAYFVQDWEPWFYPMGSSYLQAEASYELGLTPITIGRWLSSRLESKLGIPVPHTDFCADNSIYKNLNNSREHAICAIYQPEKPRRATEILAESIRIIHELRPDLTIYLYGSSSGLNIDGVNNLGVLSREGCNALYNRCLCGISMSTSNPSRIPFEMMTAGLPVVELYGEQTLYDLPGDAISLAKPDPASLATAVLSAISSRENLMHMGKAGESFMSNRPIELEGEQFVRACSNIIGGIPVAEASATKHTGTPVVASSEASRISERLHHESDMQAIERFRPISTNGTIEIISSMNDPSVTAARLAVWSGPDQSDLKWYEMERLDTESHYRCNVHLQIDGDEDAVFHFHLYVNVEGASPTLCSAIDKRIHLGSPMNDTARTSSFQSDGIGISFNGYPAEGATEPNVADTKRHGRLFDRFRSRR